MRKLFLGILLILTGCTPKGEGYSDFDFLHLKPANNSETKYKNVYCSVEGNKTTLFFRGKRFVVEKFKELGDSVSFYTGDIFDLRGNFVKDVDTMMVRHDSLICSKRHFEKIGNGIDVMSFLLWYKNGNKIVRDLGHVHPEVQSIFSKPPKFYFDYFSNQEHIQVRKIFEPTDDGILLCEYIATISGLHLEKTQKYQWKKSEIGFYARVLEINLGLEL